MPYRYDQDEDVHQFAGAMTGDYTIEMWVVFYSSASTYITLAWMGDDGPYDASIYQRGVWFGSGNTATTIEVFSRSDLAVITTPVGTIVNGQPMHIALTGNTGTGQSLSFYKNGVLIASGTSGALGTYAAEIVQIGNDPQLDGTDPDTNFSIGCISNVVHTNSIKTAAQIKAGMYDFDVARAGAWAAWRLTDSGGLTDLSGNSRTLTAGGTPTVDAWIMPNAYPSHRLPKAQRASFRKRPAGLNTAFDVREWW